MSDHGGHAETGGGGGEGGKKSFEFRDFFLVPMFGKFLSKGIVSVNGMMDLLQDFGGMMVKYPLDVLDGIGAVIKKGVNWGVKALKGGGGGGPAHAH